MKKTVLLATASVIAATSAVAVDVEMYGQVNKSFILVDDGKDTNSGVVDNDYSSTRIGVMGSQALDNGLTASVLMEFEAQSNPSNASANTNSSIGGNTASTLNERHTRVGLSGDFGAVWMGMTSTATDGASEQDLVGVKDVMSSDIGAMAGGLVFQGGTANPTVANATYLIDGGRANVLRYDSPIWNGVQGRISVANGGEVQAAVYYDGKVDAFAIKGALGYEDSEDRATATALESRVMTSVSVKHDSGIAGTIAYGSQNNTSTTAGAREDLETYYVKAGYAWDAFEVAAEYGQSTVASDDEATLMGLGAQYNMGNGVSAAAFYKQFSVDDATAAAVDSDDINVFGVNMRVKF